MKHRLRWGWPALGMLALGALCLPLSWSAGPEDWSLLGLVTVASGAVLMVPWIRGLRRPSEEILADHLWLLCGAYLIYFVAGALLIPFGPRGQAEAASTGYQVDAPLGLKVTAVNCLGMGAALSAAAVVRLSPLREWGRRALAAGRTVPEALVVAGCLLLGLYASLQIWRADFSGSGDLVSGTYRTLSQLVLAAVFFLAAHQGRRQRLCLLFALCLVSLEAAVGLLQFNKTATLLPLLAVLGGLTWRKGVSKVLIPGLAAVVCAFILSANVVSLGRSIYGAASRVDVSDRIAFIIDGLTHLQTTARDSDYSVWARFCYLPSQAAALGLHDRGNGGNDLSNLGWVFLPRALFPEKPIITATGSDFYYKLSGQEGSSSGQGIFASGYYNLGWPGVLFAGLLLGAILTWTSSLALVIFRERTLLWIPWALTGNYMAFRIDGAFVSDIWGPFALLLYLVLGARFFQRRPAPKVSRSSPPAP